MIPVGTLIEVLPPRDKWGNKIADVRKLTGLRGRVVIPEGLTIPNGKGPTDERIYVQLEQAGAIFTWPLPDYRVRIVREKTGAAHG